MTEDVADNLGMNARVDLPRRVAMTKDVTSDHRRNDTGLTRIDTDLMAEGAGRERAVG